MMENTLFDQAITQHDLNKVLTLRTVSRNRNHSGLKRENHKSTLNSELEGLEKGWKSPILGHTSK